MHFFKISFSILFCIVTIVTISSTIYANCFQGFNVDKNRTIPTTVSGINIPGQFAGRNCAELEQERTLIFLNQLSDISLKTFETYQRWSSARDKLVNRINKTRRDLNTARQKGIDAQKENALISIALAEIGTGLTLLGCPAAITGGGAVVCGGGVIFAKLSLIYALKPTGFQAKAKAFEAALEELNIILSEQDNLGKSILGERKQKFNERFEEMCHLIQNYCL